MGGGAGALGVEALLQILKNCVNSAHFGTFWDDLRYSAPCKHPTAPETNPLQHAGVKHIC